MAPDRSLWGSMITPLSLTAEHRGGLLLSTLRAAVAAVFTGGHWAYKGIACGSHKEIEKKYSHKEIFELTDEQFRVRLCLKGQLRNI